MAKVIAFTSPPYAGNMIAFVAYFAIFLAAQIALSFRYLRRWSWPIFLSLFIFLILELLGSIAYLKLVDAPVTGSWYSLWLFALTAGPTFFITSLHLSVHKILQNTYSAPQNFLRPMSRPYLIVCFSIDALSLFLQIVGGAYAGAKAHQSLAAAKPGFDVMVAAMAIQLCSLVIMLVGGLQVTISFISHHHGEKNRADSTDAATVEAKQEQTPTGRGFKKPRLFMTFLASLLFNGALLFARTIIRAVALAGGPEGAISGHLLVNVEVILLFIAILVITLLHPAIILPITGHDTMPA